MCPNKLFENEIVTQPGAIGGKKDLATNTHYTIKNSDASGQKCMFEWQLGNGMLITCNLNKILRL